MSYSVEFTAAAISHRDSLARGVQERIDKKINWLAENFDQINPIPLSANWAGLFKLRVGDYRVIYAFADDSQVITIHQIGHRKDIYD